MLKTTLKIATLSAVSLTLLSACGGGGKTPVASGIPTVNDRIASGTVFGTVDFRGSGLFDGVADNYSFTTRETEDTFSLRASGGGMIMTVNGASQTFIYRDDGGWVTGNSSFFASNAGQDIADVIDGTHPTIQGDSVQFGVSDDSLVDALFENITIISGYATIGIHTLPAAVAQQTATATYTGSFNFNFSASTGSQTLNHDVSNENFGIITMNVDFDANTIGGTATLREEGILTFDSAPISGNGFAGSFRLDAAGRTESNLTNNPVGNYAGNFFGPDADDIAGVMQMNGTHANGTLLGIGGFRADKDTQ